LDLNPERSEKVRFEMGEEEDLFAKVCLIGNTGVGKTCIMVRKMSGTYDPATRASVGADFGRLSVQGKERRIMVKLWDTAGSERFRSLSPLYLRGANVLIMVFDISDRFSFESLDEFLGFCQDMSSDCLIYLVGNKKDLAENNRAVDEKDGAEYARKIGAEAYCETSAKNGWGIDDLFSMIVDNKKLTFQVREPSPVPYFPRTKKQCQC
jgi:small GTP-binding protein